MEMDVNERYANRFLQKFKNNNIVVVIEFDYRDKIGWNILVNRGVIEHVGGTQFTITKIGLKVLKCGGWGEYLRLELLKENKKEKKENLDLLISEFQVRFKFMPHVLALIGLIISGVSLYISIKASKEVKSEKQLTIPESIKATNNTSTSNQTKKADSLHSSKIEIKP